MAKNAKFASAERFEVRFRLPDSAPDPNSLLEILVKKLGEYRAHIALSGKLHDRYLQEPKGVYTVVGTERQHMATIFATLFKEGCQHVEGTVVHKDDGTRETLSNFGLLHLLDQHGPQK